MSRIEEVFLRRFSGARIVIWSIALGLLGYMPLQLYIWFGPKDGNPIGLGLLMVATLPFASFGILIGLIKMVFEFFRRSE